MSKIKDALLEAEEQYGDELHQAMDEWDVAKMNAIVFRTEMVNGKKVIKNVKG